MNLQIFGMHSCYASCGMLLKSLKITPEACKTLDSLKYVAQRKHDKTGGRGACDISQALLKSAINWRETSKDRRLAHKPPACDMENAYIVCHTTLLSHCCALFDKIRILQEGKDGLTRLQDDEGTITHDKLAMLGTKMNGNTARVFSFSPFIQSPKAII